MPERLKIITLMACKQKCGCVENYCLIYIWIINFLTSYIVYESFEPEGIFSYT